jgi:hypothetical protein
MSFVASPSCGHVSPYGHRLTDEVVGSSAPICSTPNQMHSLVCIYHRAVSWRFHKCLLFDLVELVYNWFLASTLHGVGPLLSHVVMISLVPSCICPVRLSKRMSSLIAPRIDSVWKFLPRWVMSSSTLEFKKVPFPFQASARVTGSGRSRNEAPKQTESWGTISFYKVLCHLCVERKVAWKTDKFSYFQRTQCPPLSMVNALFIVSCTPSPLPPPPSPSSRKSQDQISFRGGGGDCNTSCYGFPNHLH